jgi:hypothetical protein
MVVKKSKFIVFILSPIPGLSHLYLGMTDRALTFFILFIAVCGGGATINSLLSGFDLLGPVLFMSIVIIWFIALVDAFALIDNRRLCEPGDNENISANQGIPALNNRKIITITLSMIPGAGHMYLGLLKQGAQLMTAFFLVMFVTDWLNMSLLTFVLPVLWFYSLFDAYHLLEEETDGLQPDESPLFDWFTSRPAWIGWGLIFLGGLVMFQRIVAPILISLLSADVRNFVETAVVALIFIAGGIKMLASTKSAQKMEDIE